MKNVTGLDLVKLSCGAHGTLGLITEVAFKLRPRAPDAATLAIEGLDDMRAVEALSAGLGSPFEVSGAAHLPAGVLFAQSRTLLRLENFPESVEYRFAELATLLASFGVARRMDVDETRTAWRAVRDVEPLALHGNALWRISVAPTRGPEIVAALQRDLSFRHYYDWGGGLIWLACATSGDAGAAAIRKAVAAAHGHATLVRAPDDLRARVDVFEPQSEAMMKLTRGVKASFDPAGIFNPGRMYAGV